MISILLCSFNLFCTSQKSGDKLETELNFKTGVHKINIDELIKVDRIFPSRYKSLENLKIPDSFVSDSFQQKWIFFKGFNQEDHRIALVYEHPISTSSKIIIDENNNENLCDDKIRKWSFTKADTFLVWKFNYSCKDSLGVQQGACALKIINKDNHIYAYNDGYRTGIFTVKNESYKFALYDMNFDGLFSEQDAILVDVNRDGILDGEFSGTSIAYEFYYLYEPFKIDNKSYIISSVSPIGDKIKFSISEKQAVQRYPLKPGNPTPNFSIKTLNSENISLSDFKGKVILIDFWAVWCRPCIKEMPYIREAYKVLPQNEFQIISVNLNHDLELLNNYLKDNPIPWIIFNDGRRFDNKIAKLFRLIGIPQTFLIDKEGIIRFVYVRAEDILKKAKLLIGKE